MNLFECTLAGGGSLTLEVTCHSNFAGLTITCSDGITTLTQTCPSSSPYTVSFKLPNAGEWQVSTTYNSVTYSETATVELEVELTPVPDGATATPTDDIQTWLNCANIFDKTTYTTIADVLADTTSLLALISSNNAVDYMVRSTTWASSVCADSTAMTYIGANNYCADALLSDSTWLNAIVSSTYFESVLNVKIPTMTSNTTPSGICDQSSVYEGSYGYFALDGSTSSSWVASVGATNQWVEYDFPSNTIVKMYKAVISTDNGYGGTRAKNYKLQYYDENNSSWEDLATGTFASGGGGQPGQTKIFNIDGSEANKFRALVIDQYTSYCIQLNTLQFYGRAAS